MLSAFLKYFSNINLPELCCKEDISGNVVDSKIQTCVLKNALNCLKEG